MDNNPLTPPKTQPPQESKVSLTTVISIFLAVTFATGFAYNYWKSDRDNSDEVVSSDSTDMAGYAPDLDDPLGFVSGEKVDYTIRYDSDKWLVTDETMKTDFEYQFSHDEGDVYAFVIPERIKIPLESLKKIALENMDSVASEKEIVMEEKRVVNGVEVLALQVKATVDGLPFHYYSYYYAGSAGAIQVTTYTSQNLFAEYESEMLEFLNGLEVTEPLGALGDSTEPVSDNDLEVIKGKKVTYGIAYDPEKWLFTEAEPGGDSEYEFEHRDGDVYAMVIPERLQIPLETLKNIAIANAEDVSPDVKVTFTENRTVNGKEVLAMKMVGTIEGINFSYYGYYYTGKAGAIQFLTYTGENLATEYENDLTELLNGFQVYEQ